MRRRGVWMLVVIAPLVVAACGSSSSAKPRPLAARLIRPGELKGFTGDTPQTFRTAKALIAYDTNRGLPTGEGAVLLARLNKEGFEADSIENLTGNYANPGISEVMQFAAAGSARAELAAERQLHRAQRFITFPVENVPGAVGFGTSGVNGGGDNIQFADGPFLYTLGYAWYSPNERPKRTVLIDAATKLYQRVHGHPPN